MTPQTRSGALLAGDSCSDAVMRVGEVVVTHENPS
jgi:hypothetical protein